MNNLLVTVSLSHLNWPGLMERKRHENMTSVVCISLCLNKFCKVHTQNVSLCSTDVAEGGGGTGRVELLCL